MENSEKRDLIGEMKKIHAECQHIMDELFAKLKAIENEANDPVVTLAIERAIENIYGGENEQN